MSRVRVLVGTRKGAFVLTSDGQRQQWEVSGPHFGGWEIITSPDLPRTQCGSMHLNRLAGSGS